MSHQQGQGIPMSQQQYGQQSIDEQDLFSDYQQLFVDTHQAGEFNNNSNNGFYNNSPQYPTHFIPQETQAGQQFVNLMNFPNSTSSSSSYQGNYDGVPISGPNHQSRIYDNMTNQLQNFQPMHQQQYQQQLQQQMLLQRQQQLHLQQQMQRQKQQQQFHHQYRPQQQQQQILFQQQHSPIPSSKSSQKRSSRNTKRKVKYDESSDDEEEIVNDDEDDDEEEIEQLPEQSDDSDFDQPIHNKKTDVPVVMIPMGTKTFEKMLDYRLNQRTGQHELLVKYKYSSYHHVEWLPKEKIEAEHLGKHRVKKFLTKWNLDGQKGEDYSEYLKVDRIIDEGELADPITGEPSIFYLVKWNGLFYDASTWESEEDVQKVSNSL